MPGMIHPDSANLDHGAHDGDGLHYVPVVLLILEVADFKARDEFTNLEDVSRYVAKALLDTVDTGYLVIIR